MKDDFIRPFQIERPGIRGRLVRLGPAVDEILNRHDYPLAVGRLLGEALALVAVIAGALKFEGIFTLQIKGDGPIPLLLADFRSPGSLRGYARFHEKELALTQNSDCTTNLSIKNLLGVGIAAFTIDSGGKTDRYQGIVSLEGHSLADCANKYFRESEQTDTNILLAADNITNAAGSRSWRAGAIMVQRLPGDRLNSTFSAKQIENELAGDENWRRIVALFDSVTNKEILNAKLHSDDLLYQIYHEDGVRVFDPINLIAACACSEKRAENVLRSLPAAELPDLCIDGNLEMNCEFCNRTYIFPLERLKKQQGSGNGK